MAGTWIAEHGLATRLADLPLILCGPVLGRVEPESVTVWVALKEARTATLRVYARSPPPAPTALAERAIGTRRTIRLGASLHVVAVTAAAPTSEPLVPGELYFYDLFFAAGAAAPVPDSADALRTPGIADPVATSLDRLDPSNLSYSQEHRLPSFSLPPATLNELRIVNGSCRKPHGEGVDAFPVLDEMIAADWPVADERPHQLLLTGDQIYADGIPGMTLFMLDDAERALLGWEEPLPGVPATSSNLQPGSREQLVKELAGLTTGGFESHPLRLAEFVGLYLFAWSGVLWPAVFPEAEDVFAGIPSTSPGSPAAFVNGSTPEVRNALHVGFDTNRTRLDGFRKTLPQVRRALANVPTYMMLDDHDVTDDWNMYRDWVTRVYPKPLGRRVIQNGLAAYALCQAWSGVPDRFAGGTPGDALLQAIEAWAAKNGNDAVSHDEIANRVGIPPVQTGAGGAVTGGLFKAAADGDVLERPPGALDWHYTVSGPKHDVLVLDSRTRRSFPPKALDVPAHIGVESLREQIPLDPVAQDRVTLVVATTNVLTVPFFQGNAFYGDRRARKMFRWSYLVMALLRDRIFERCCRDDYEPDLSDSWESHTPPFEGLIARLARRAAPLPDNRRGSRVIVLSGDVHFSWAGRLQYWGDRPFGEDAAQPARPLDSVFAFLTASAFKAHTNTVSGLVHSYGYNLDPPFAEESLAKPALWFGWRERTALGVSGRDIARVGDWVHYQPWMLRQTPPMLALDDVPTDHSVPRPDWRYRIDFMLGEQSNRSHEVLSDLAKPPDGDRDGWLKTFTEANQRHRDYAQKFGEGLEMIGKNNIAVLRFQWEGATTLAEQLAAGATSVPLTDSAGFPDAPFRAIVGAETLEVGALDRVTHVCSQLERGVNGSTAAAHAAGAAIAVAKTAVQTHWWRLTDAVKLHPLTTYRVSLEFEDARYPRFKLPGEP